MGIHGNYCELSSSWILENTRDPIHQDPGIELEIAEKSWEDFGGSEAQDLPITSSSFFIHIHPRSQSITVNHSQSQSQKTSKNRLSLGFFPSSKVQNQDIPGYSTYVGHLDPFRPRSPRSPSSKRREQLIHFQRRYLPKRPHGNFQTKLWRSRF